MAEPHLPTAEELARMAAAQGQGQSRGTQQVEIPMMEPAPVPSAITIVTRDQMVAKTDPATGKPELDDKGQPIPVMGKVVIAFICDCTGVKNVFLDADQADRIGEMFKAKAQEARSRLTVVQTDGVIQLGTGNPGNGDGPVPG